MSYAAMTCLAILVTPFLTAAGILLLRNHPKKRDLLAIIAPFLPLVLFSLLVTSGETEVRFDALTISARLVVGIALEPLGLVFTGLVAVLWPLTALYTSSFLRANKLRNKTRFLAFFSLAVGCTFGIALAGDLLTLFIFYELLTFCTYPLIVHSQTGAARNSGRLYLAMLLGSSFLFLLPLVIWLWLQCGTLSFTAGGFIKNCENAGNTNLLLLFLIMGVGKAAIMPMHKWLPAAMVAPAPVSALLHAVAVVKGGVFTIVKTLIYVFGIDHLAQINSEWLVYLAGSSTLIAYLIATRQDSLKKRLAYSTVGQLSLIVMGAALLKPALLGALFNFVAHAVGKITLFFAAGAIQTASGISKVSDMGGLGRTMPVTIACFAVASMSLIGFPPLAGFIVKLWLFQGAVAAADYFAVATLILSTLLNGAMLLPIIWRAYAETPQKYSPNPPMAMQVSMLIPVIALPIMFFFSWPLLRLFETIK